MNANRRKQVKVAMGQLEMLMASIEGIRDEEQDYYDNMPEAIQVGVKGDKAQEYIDSLDDCFNELESVSYSLADVLNNR